MVEHLSQAEFERRAAWWNGLEERHRREMLMSPSVTPKTVDQCWKVFGPDSGKRTRGRGKRKPAGSFFL